MLERCMKRGATILVAAVVAGFSSNDFIDVAAAWTAADLRSSLRLGPSTIWSHDNGRTKLFATETGGAFRSQSDRLNERRKRGDDGAIELSQESKEDMIFLAKQLNPVIGFWDPLGIFREHEPWPSLTMKQRIGWFRHAEIKHGRVAMAACIGYIVQSVYHWPWAVTLDHAPFPSIDLSPSQQWDELPFAGKLQILAFIGFFEFYSEQSPPLGKKDGGMPHYTKPGGIPGKFPSLDGNAHPVPFDLYDPFGISRNASADFKARGRLAEINHGRLAQIGIISFLCEEKIPGSVPLLHDIVKPYSGEHMAPFEANWHLI
jgi:Chlorophyll A-B binding protein